MSFTLPKKWRLTTKNFKNKDNVLELQICISELYKQKKEISKIARLMKCLEKRKEESEKRKKDYCSRIQNVMEKEKTTFKNNNKEKADKSFEKEKQVHTKVNNDVHKEILVKETRDGKKPELSVEKKKPFCPEKKCEFKRSGKRS